MKNTIIAFSGKARSGKTTAAKTITSHNNGFVILSFATPLKRMAMEQFDLTPEDIEDKDKVLYLGGKEINIRGLLIEIGLMYRRLDSDFWVKRLWREAEKAIAHGNNILIDDMRFKNEAKFLVDKGAILVRVSRPGVKLINDPSETELDEYNFKHLLNNTGGLEDYQQNSLLMYELLKNRNPAAK